MNEFSKTFVVAALFSSAVFGAACASAKPEIAADQIPAAAVSENAGSTAASAAETIKITVSTVYEPKSVAVKKDQPVKLAFYRQSDENCGDEVVFPKLGIRKNLPVGETVVVELTPPETGELGFTCGMNMMRGKLVVSD